MFTLLPLLTGLAVGILLAAALAWLGWGRPGAEARLKLAQVEADLAARREQLASAAAELRAEQEKAQAGERWRAALDEERQRHQESLSALAALRAEAEAGQRHWAEQAAQLAAVRDSMQKDFHALADAALRRSQQSFFELADQNFLKHREAAGEQMVRTRADFEALLAPLRETLGRYEQNLGAVEKARAEGYGGLQAQLIAMLEDQRRLREETQKLVHALKSGPKARGRWGEQQLRNVLEMAGLAEHVDFETEVSVAREDGRLRPDAVVRLPGGRQLVIDAKTSLNAFQEAMDATDDAIRLSFLKAHADAMRTHVDQLGRKDYWSQFDHTLDLVIMFIPGEHFATAAFEIYPSLWEDAFSKRVLIATPTNLIAIARTIAYGWRQETLTRQAQQIGLIGKELYLRLGQMGGRLQKLGERMTGATDAYNELIGTIERRVMPQARKFAELQLDGPGGAGLPTPEPIELMARAPLAGRDLLFAPEPADGEDGG